MIAYGSINKETISNNPVACNLEKFQNLETEH